jgi:hypothetical protein
MRPWERSSLVATGALVVVVILVVAFMPHGGTNHPKDTRAEINASVRKALAAKRTLESKATAPPTVAAYPPVPPPLSVCTLNGGPCVPPPPGTCIDATPTLEIEPRCPATPPAQPVSG